MTAKAKELLRKARALSVDQRLRLAEAIHDSAQADASAEPLTPWQIKELERRLEEDDLRPDDVVSWDDAKARINKTLSKRR